MMQMNERFHGQDVKVSLEHEDAIYSATLAPTGEVRIEAHDSPPSAPAHWNPATRRIVDVVEPMPLAVLDSLSAQIAEALDRRHEAEGQEDDDAPEITVELDSPVGPRVVYVEGATIEDVSAALPAGWSASFVDQVRTDSGRFSTPLVRSRAPGEPFTLSPRASEQERRELAALVGLASTALASATERRDAFAGVLDALLKLDGMDSSEDAQAVIVSAARRAARGFDLARAFVAKAATLKREAMDSAHRLAVSDADLAALAPLDALDLLVSSPAATEVLARTRAAAAPKPPATPAEAEPEMHGARPTPAALVEALRREHRDESAPLRKRLLGDVLEALDAGAEVEDLYQITEDLARAVDAIRIAGPEAGGAAPSEAALCSRGPHQVQSVCPVASPFGGPCIPCEVKA